MSPCDEVTTIEMSPNLEVSTGGQIGKDSDELQGVGTSRGLGTSGKRRTETSQRRGDSPFRSGHLQFRTRAALQAEILALRHQLTLALQPGTAHI